MEELQQQILDWCESLTDYLKCDQCDKKLAKDIYLCETGHLICWSCSQDSSPSDKCSICHKKYTKTRNYLAENLSQKMEKIIEKIGSPDDDDDLRSVCSEASNFVYPPFSCRIGSCKAQGSIDEIRRHYQENHSGLYVKHCDDSLPHTTIFPLEYSFAKTMHRILDIPNVGLFLLQVVIFDNGALRAHFFMYENKRNANKFQYKLKIQCKAQNSSVEGEVDTVRLPRSAFSKKGLFVPRAHNLQIELANSTKFTCRLELDKRSGNPEENPPSEPRKRPQKNRNKSSNETHQNGQNDQEKSKNPNPRKTNAQKKQNPDVKGENGKKTVEKKSAEGQNHQPRVNNPLQTNGGNIPSLFGHQPPFSPLNHPVGSQMGYQSHNAAFNYPGVPQGLPPQGLQHNPQHFGAAPSPFPGANPYYPPPPPPGTPGIRGAHYELPSAPAEDGAHVQYPDLTKMKQKMGTDRFSEVQRRAYEKERARKSSTESKDKCVIS